VVLVFVQPNSSYVRPKLKVIGQMSCQVKYLFAALECTDNVPQISQYMARIKRPLIVKIEAQKLNFILYTHNIKIRTIYIICG
jgi:hypothetical protein